MSDNELIWHPFQPTLSDLEFMESMQKWQKEFAEKYGITSPIVGVVSKPSDEEIQEVQEKTLQMLIEVAQEVAERHEQS